MNFFQKLFTPPQNSFFGQPASNQNNLLEELLKSQTANQLGSPGNVDPMVPKTNPTVSNKLSLFGAPKTSNSITGLLGNPYFAIGSALLNPRQSFGQNLQQGFQNLMQQQMYKQEQERKNRADMIQLAPLIKQQQIQNILAGGITTENVAEASKIDPILTGKIVKSAADVAQNQTKLKAFQGGQPLANAGDTAYNYGLSAGLKPEQLTAAKALGDSIRTGQLVPTSPQGILQINQVNNQIESMIERDFRRKMETGRFGIAERQEQRAEAGDTGDQSEAQAATFLTRMLGANKRINSPAFDETGKPILIDGKPVSIADVANKPEISAKLAGIFGSTAENIFTSPNRQVYKNAAMDWITANLRKESGAVISEIEFERDFVKFFPQIGDSQKVIEAKREARKNAEKGMRASAGKAIKRLPDLDQENTTNQQQPNQQSNVGQTPTLEELLEEKRRRQQ